VSPQSADQGCYNSLATLVNPAALEARLRQIHGVGLDVDRFEHDVDVDVDLRLARQFAWLHRRSPPEGDAEDRLQDKPED